MAETATSPDLPDPDTLINRGLILQWLYWGLF
jgi:hypothetical protein